MHFLFILKTWFDSLFIPLIAILPLLPTLYASLNRLLTYLNTPTKEERQIHRLRREIHKRNVNIAAQKRHLAAAHATIAGYKRYLATAHETTTTCARQREALVQEHHEHVGQLVREFRQYDIDLRVMFDRERRILDGEVMYCHEQLLYAQRRERRVQKRLAAEKVKGAYVCYGEWSCSWKDCFCRRVVGEVEGIGGDWSEVDAETEEETDFEMEL